MSVCSLLPNLLGKGKGEVKWCVLIMQCSEALPNEDRHSTQSDFAFEMGNEVVVSVAASFCHFLICFYRLLLVNCFCCLSHAVDVDYRCRHCFPFICNVNEKKEERIIHSHILPRSIDRSIRGDRATVESMLRCWCHTLVLVLACSIWVFRVSITDGADLF